MKRLLVILTLSTLIIAAASVMAQDGPPPAPGAPAGMARPSAPGSPNMVVPAPCISSAMRLVHPRMMPTLDEKLALTAEQKGKINDLLMKSEEEGVQLVMAQRKASEDFAVVLAKPNATEAEITAAAKKAMDAETAIITAKAKTMIEIRSALTEEQKKAFTEMLEQYTTMWRVKPGTRPAMGAPVPPQGAVK